MATTLYKPAGLPVFPPHAYPKGDCLLKRLLHDQPWRADIPWPPGFEAGIAHRLDNATSGAVLVADSLDELALFRSWFREKRFVKTYLMLAARSVPWHRRTCTRPIAHHPTKKNRMIVQRSPHTPHRGKWYPAVSHFQRLPSPPPNLWQVRITTGVMHQIRAHAAFLGIPILGDRIYGGGSAPHMIFYLHHLGMTGPDGFHTDPVPLPDWARSP